MKETLGIWLVLCAAFVITGRAEEARKPRTQRELSSWLQNMRAYHGYSTAEIKAATGLEEAEIEAELKRQRIQPLQHPPFREKGVLTILPYPGGRHPRIGFLEGAIDPQRETKFSVFAPWDQKSYFVVDLPEAIWCQDGLLYLAHTHVPTIWTKQNIRLDQLEWQNEDHGALRSERTLHNGVSFGAFVVPEKNAVKMELWLKNDSNKTLRDLRVQNCIMLKGAEGFNQQTNANKIFSGPFAACRSAKDDRWIITAWLPSHRTWGNAPVPCLHADPKFPDSAPGERKTLRGWLSFYQGKDVQSEFKRIASEPWLAELPRQ